MSGTAGPTGCARIARGAGGGGGPKVLAIRKLRVGVARWDKNRKFWLIFRTFSAVALRAAEEKVVDCATLAGLQRANQKSEGDEHGISIGAVEDERGVRGGERRAAAERDG